MRCAFVQRLDGAPEATNIGQRRGSTDNRSAKGDLNERLDSLGSSAGTTATRPRCPYPDQSDATRVSPPRLRSVKDGA